MTISEAASEITIAGQIDKAVANYRALLEENSRYFNTEAVQIVLDQSEIAGKQFAVFRQCVEEVEAMALIIRRVTVNRTRTPQESLDATGYKQCTDSNIVDAMPKGKGEKVEVVFFKLNLSECNGHISDDDLEKEFELRGLKPADPISVVAVNEADSGFMMKYRNGTHWKDAKNNEWCFATFCRKYGEYRVTVNSNRYDWPDDWWFAGIRK